MKDNTTGKPMRHSRFERSRKAPRINLQLRDRTILEAIARYGLLSRSQLQRLLDWHCTTRINIRLRKLWENRLLDRQFLPAVTGSSQAIYSLGRKASKAFPDVETKAARGSSFLFLSHILDVAEVRLAFDLAWRHWPGFEIEEWLISSTLAETRFRECLGLIPDGFCCYRRPAEDGSGSKRWSVFLEVDRGMESLSIFARKVERYLAYAESGRHQELFRLRFFRVLCVGLSEKRLRNLRTVVQRYTDKGFRFTLLESIKPETILGPIWLLPQGEERVPL
ncbi:MAG TPA: replication-relaxation family protein [Candidatus Xenobia bacterium]|nr:replication-relaxation family protein [Candidatus Xenobia bacterium]